MAAMGLWRGRVVKVDADGFIWVSVPRLSSIIYGPLEPLVGVTLVEDDRVLVAFLEGQSSDLVIVRKAQPSAANVPARGSFNQASDLILNTGNRTARVPLSVGAVYPNSGSLVLADSDLVVMPSEAGVYQFGFLGALIPPLGAGPSEAVYGSLEIAWWLPGSGSPIASLGFCEIVTAVPGPSGYVLSVTTPAFPFPGSIGVHGVSVLLDMSRIPAPLENWTVTGGVLTCQRLA